MSSHHIDAGQSPQHSYATCGLLCSCLVLYAQCIGLESGLAAQCAVSCGGAASVEVAAAVLAVEVAAVGLIASAESLECCERGGVRAEDSTWAWGWAGEWRWDVSPSSPSTRLLQVGHFLLCCSHGRTHSSWKRC